MLGQIVTANPTSVLDVGIGYGKWGFLCREYLESWQDRVFPTQWQVKITGVEAFSEYVNRLPWLNQIYDRIYVRRIQDVCDVLASHELVIAGDVIEHLEKRAANRVLETLKRKATKRFLLSIPLGPGWLDNKVIAGNEFEQHRSEWSKDDVEDLLGPASGFWNFGQHGKQIGVFAFDA